MATTGENEPFSSLSSTVQETMQWGRRIGLPVLSDAEVLQSYERAKPYLVRLKDEFLRGYPSNWTLVHEESDDRSSTLFALVTSRGLHPNGLSDLRFALPSSVKTFYNADFRRNWCSFYDDIFPGDRSKRTSGDIVINAPKPVTDMFYLLQCTAPGLFLIICVEDIEDFGTETLTRVLPRKEWIYQNEDMLIDVLGEERYDDLCHAAQQGICIDSDASVLFERYASNPSPEPAFIASGLETNY